MKFGLDASLEASDPASASEQTAEKSLFCLGQLQFEIRNPLDESLRVGEVPQSLRGPSGLITGGAQTSITKVD